MNAMLHLSTVAVFIVFSGCASVASQAPAPKWAENYLPKVRDEIEPIWEKATNHEIKRLLDFVLKTN